MFTAGAPEMTYINMLRGKGPEASGHRRGSKRLLLPLAAGRESDVGAAQQNANNKSVATAALADQARPAKKPRAKAAVPRGRGLSHGSASPQPQQQHHDEPEVLEDDHRGQDHGHEERQALEEDDQSPQDQAIQASRAEAEPDEPDDPDDLRSESDDIEHELSELLSELSDSGDAAVAEAELEAEAEAVAETDRAAVPQQEAPEAPEVPRPPTAVPVSVNPLVWGSFRLTEKQAGPKSTKFGGCQVFCPFHRKSATSACTKFFAHPGLTAADKLDTLRRLQYWASQARFQIKFHSFAGLLMADDRRADGQLTLQTTNNRRRTMNLQNIVLVVVCSMIQ